ncbi:GAF domain-containing protein [Neisseria sp. ZJ106]|uniref:GAF domain-containing protein n=1 Tax=Neisseria lisongii TaxID=2912188 RepID=A0ABY7RIY5_9NEIS|nr:GAF domain-containing protein [Neisseria lisongii]MCF7520460.1 GAF domain-containing protein [Neisseria lisongii]WCL71597.1 GAF domain-containing protein [Neisseria lisongii]
MHTVNVTAADKAERYREVLPQIECVIADETDLIANLANTAAVLKATFGWFWVGFYLIDRRRNELVLGPFQGPLACTRIGFGKGVCGQAWEKRETVVVEDVNRHPGHIACSSLSQSEIVVPLFDADGQCFGVLDIDDDKLAQFDDTDAVYLAQLARMLTQAHARQAV